MTAPTTVLCVNCGSSSVKAALFRGESDAPLTGLVRLVRLEAAGLGTAEPTLVVDDGRPRPLALDLAGAGGGDTAPATDDDAHGQAVREILATIDQLDVPAVDVVGHRVVHGGTSFLEPVRVDGAVLAELEGLVPLAPLHLPAELSALRAVARFRPDVPQIACFDTAFHATLPEEAWRLPLPRWTSDVGIRRYGFHGLSYEWVVGSLGPDVLGRVVIAHLGNGASLAAVDRTGCCVDTTMGMTPTGGLVMGTRTGDLDPGVLVHLLRHEGLSVDELAELVDHRSGLLGLSEESSDMRVLLEAAQGSDDAAQRAGLAVEVFCRQAAKHIAAMTASLCGIDTLVFTGGIGEHAPEVRRRIAARLGALGVAVDAAANDAAAPIISPSSAPVMVRVHPTDEEAVVAHHALRLIAPGTRR